MMFEQIVTNCRQQFPALARHYNEQPVVYFDGPAGTQVPERVPQAMTEYMIRHNANRGGLFVTGVESDKLLAEAHQAAADFLGTDDPDEIAFGQNMTSLTFALARSLARTWSSDDEIVVTRLDHDANISPWVTAAEDCGAKIHYINFNQHDYGLELDQLASSLNHRTRLVAIGAASNATGGVNPVAEICQMAHDAGALVFVDAVHYGPHGLIDVQKWQCDFLACSAYKFFGPHLGMLWGRRELLESLTAYKVRPAGNEIPDKWMNGTQSHESIHGTRHCIDYLADLGRELAVDPTLARRQALTTAFEGIQKYEQGLSSRLLNGLAELPDLKVYGITATDDLDRRFPTFSITHPAIKTTTLAEQLAGQGIFVWNGNYYALQFTETLGLEPEGMIRIGLVHYNTPEEIDRLIGTLSACFSSLAS